MERGENEDLRHHLGIELLELDKGDGSKGCRT